MHLSSLIIWISPFLVLGFSGGCLIFIVICTEIPVSKQCWTWSDAVFYSIWNWSASKQCWTWSDAVFCSIWTESALSTCPDYSFSQKKVQSQTWKSLSTTYLQCTITGSTIPTRFCRTLTTNSKKSAGSSGTPWSGHAIYCMWDICLSSFVWKIKYDAD